MLAELEDFRCEHNQIGRFEIHPDLIKAPELGLTLGLMGFTPLRVEASARGYWLDVMGLSPLFVAVAEGNEIPCYSLEIVRHEGDDMIDPSINCPAPYVIELHLGEG